MGTIVGGGNAEWVGKGVRVRVRRSAEEKMKKIQQKHKMFFFLFHSKNPNQKNTNKLGKNDLKKLTS